LSFFLFNHFSSSEINFQSAWSSAVRCGGGRKERQRSIAVQGGDGGVMCNPSAKARFWVCEVLKLVLYHHTSAATFAGFLQAS